MISKDILCLRLTAELYSFPLRILHPTVWTRFGVAKCPSIENRVNRCVCVWTKNEEIGDKIENVSRQKKVEEYRLLR